MNLLRYVIEAKDQHGWFDYSILSDKDAAVKLIKELKESFGDNLKLIDKQNMLEIKVD